jgi:acetyl-CoA C-acetyltransferase
MTAVAILGATQTKHSKSRSDANYMELAFEVVTKLLEETGVKHSEIDTVITASSDFWDGRTISDIAVQDAVGAAGKSASKVSMDGAFSLVYASARISSGAFKNCLVVGHGKASEGQARKIANAAFDPHYQRPLGIDDHGALGLQARAYLQEKNLSPEMLAETAAQSAHCYAKNPYSHRTTNWTSEAIQKSQLIADPLHELEIAPDSDGACAMLLCNEKEAQKRETTSIWLDGFGFATDVHSLGDRHLGKPSILSQVSQQAFRRAGIQDYREIDIAEVHDASSAQTLMWKEDMGLQNHSHLLWNPSGGAMGAQPGFATGLVRVAEVYQRLKKGAARTGLAHGMTGFVGQAHCVWVLRRR